jgi:hypothetical protein
MMDGKEEENKTGEINQPQEISVEEKKRDEGWCNLNFWGGGQQQVFRFPSSASPWKPTDPKLSAPPSRLENLGTNQEPSTSPLLLLFNGPPPEKSNTVSTSTNSDSTPHPADNISHIAAIVAFSPCSMLNGIIKSSWIPIPSVDPTMELLFDMWNLLYSN